MRLYPDEIDALKFALNGINDDIFIFGSRVDNTKKGGDIDLLIFSPIPGYKLSLKIKQRFFSKCEEKLDVIVINPDKMTKEQHAFVNSINKIKLDINDEQFTNTGKAK